MSAGTHTGRPVNGSWPRVAVRARAPRTPPVAAGFEAWAPRTPPSPFPPEPCAAPAAAVVLVLVVVDVDPVVVEVVD